jgi:hypothetical protein
VTTLEEPAALARDERGGDRRHFARRRDDPVIPRQRGHRPSPGHRRARSGVRRQRPGKARQPARPAPGDRHVPQRPAVGSSRRTRRAGRAGRSQPWPDPEPLRLLLRETFSAAGGEHDDWDTYDRAMAEERRAAALVRPDRVYTSR